MPDLPYGNSALLPIWSLRPLTCAGMCVYITYMCTIDTVTDQYSDVTGHTLGSGVEIAGELWLFFGLLHLCNI